MVWHNRQSLLSCSIFMIWYCTFDVILRSCVVLGRRKNYWKADFMVKRLSFDFFTFHGIFILLKLEWLVYLHLNPFNRSIENVNLRRLFERYILNNSCMVTGVCSDDDNAVFKILIVVNLSALAGNLKLKTDERSFLSSPRSLTSSCQKLWAMKPSAACTWKYSILGKRYAPEPENRSGKAIMVRSQSSVKYAHDSCSSNLGWNRQAWIVTSRPTRKTYVNYADTGES